jgi:hypothetical protein
MVIAGSPVGSPTFLRDSGRQRTKQVTGAVTTLKVLPLELQDKFLLLHISMILRHASLIYMGPLEPNRGCVVKEVKTAAHAIQETGGEQVGPLQSSTA